MNHTASAILNNHPEALALGQSLMGLAMLAALLWAGRRVKAPRHSAPLRKLKSETCVAVESAPRALRTETELARDANLIRAIQRRQKTARTPGIVVVVEDHEVVLTVTEALLQQVGIATRGARTIQETLPFTSTDDVLVADWNLPDGTAAELAAEYRKVRPDGLVLITSAMDVRPDNMPPGAIWLQKPYDPDFFIALVRKMLVGE